MCKNLNQAKNYFYRLSASLMIMIFALLVSACGGAEYSRNAEAPAAQVAADEAYYQEEPLPAGEAKIDYADGESIPVEDFLANAVSQAQAVRVIIYTGDISLVVKRTEDAVIAVTRLADEHGGYVSGSNVYQSGEVLRGTMSLRIPADRYPQVMDQLRNLALRVERESSSTQDVTEEFTDLQARKTNLEHTEAALQELLNERKRVGSTSDILEVHRELTNIRGQIEQIEGRMRYLANQSALSTIQIELLPDALYQPISVAGWQPQGVAKEALQSLITALQGLTNLAIWLIIFVLPLFIIMLIPLVVVILVIRWGWKRRRSRAKSKASSPSPPAQSTESKET